MGVPSVQPGSAAFAGMSRRWRGRCPYFRRRCCQFEHTFVEVASSSLVGQQPLSRDEFDQLSTAVYRLAAAVMWTFRVAQVQKVEKTVEIPQLLAVQKFVETLESQMVQDTLASDCSEVLEIGPPLPADSATAAARARLALPATVLIAQLSLRVLAGPTGQTSGTAWTRRSVMVPQLVSVQHTVAPAADMRLSAMYCARASFCNRPVQSAVRATSTLIPPWHFSGQPPQHLVEVIQELEAIHQTFSVILAQERGAAMDAE